MARILTTLEYMGGTYELVVLTETKEQGRKAIEAHLKGDGLGLRYYSSTKEFLDEMLNQYEITEGEVFAK